MSPMINPFLFEGVDQTDKLQTGTLGSCLICPVCAFFESLKSKMRKTITKQDEPTI
jgi:hypothetical protein